MVEQKNPAAAPRKPVKMQKLNVSRKDISKSESIGQVGVDEETPLDQFFQTQSDKAGAEAT
jgi:hypothetical protein